MYILDYEFAYCWWLNPTPIDGQFKFRQSVIIYIAHMCISHVMQNLNHQRYGCATANSPRPNTAVFHIFDQEHCPWNPSWGVWFRPLEPPCWNESNRNVNLVSNKEHIPSSFPRWDNTLSLCLNVRFFIEWVSRMLSFQGKKCCELTDVLNSSITLSSYENLVDISPYHGLALVIVLSLHHWLCDQTPTIFYHHINWSGRIGSCNSKERVPTQLNSI